MRVSISSMENSKESVIKSDFLDCNKGIIEMKHDHLKNLVKTQCVDRNF